MMCFMMQYIHFLKIPGLKGVVWLDLKSQIYVILTTFLHCIESRFFTNESPGKPTHWKSPWCWERLKAEGEEGVRGWDGWMASLMQWTWTEVNSGRWWGTGKPGALQSWGHKELDMTGELNNNRYHPSFFFGPAACGILVPEWGSAQGPWSESPQP